MLGFIDGAWKMDAMGRIKASIGGFLMNINNSIIFVFSGPIIAPSPYDSELAALTFLMDQLETSTFEDLNTTIFSDSKKLVSNMHSFRSRGSHTSNYT